MPAILKPSERKSLGQYRTRITNRDPSSLKDTHTLHHLILEGLKYDEVVIEVYKTENFVIFINIGESALLLEELPSTPGSPKFSVMTKDQRYSIPLGGLAIIKIPSQDRSGKSILATIFISKESYYGGNLYFII